MNDDIWLKELAQVHRERETEERSRFDERWDRLSAGTLSPEEDAELQALAATSEEARAAYEAFRPLGADFQARVVQEIQKRGLVPAPKSPDPLPFRRFTPQTFRWGAAAAIAAAVLFFVIRPFLYPPLPVYTAELSRGDQQFRGGTETATGLPVFSPGSVLTLDVAPQRPVTDPVEAHAFLARGGEIVPWEPAPPLETVNGAVRLRGTLGQEVWLPPGESRIWIVVGRRGEIPPLEELAGELRAGRASHRGWQAVHADLRVEDRAPP